MAQDWKGLTDEEKALAALVSIAESLKVLAALAQAAASKEKAA